MTAMTAPKDERRRAARQLLRTNAQLLLVAGLIVNARTSNISASGIALVTDGPISAGTSLTMRCHVLVNGARQELITPVRVAHSVFSSADSGFVVGFAFTGQSAAAASLITALVSAR